MRGSRPGERRGGRKKGQPNRRTRDLQELLDKMDHDPKEAMILIAKGEMPCGTCRGKGKTKYKISGTDRHAERVCESCYGSLMEKLSPALIYDANKELVNYLLPKRKAIEHSGQLTIDRAAILRRRFDRAASKSTP